MEHNLKSVTLDNLPESAWRYITGEGVPGDYTIGALRKSIPTLWRGIQWRAGKVAGLPFVINDKGGHEIDNSKKYTNATGFLPNLRRLLWQLETSLTIYGRAYAFVEASPFKVVNVRYIAPGTTTPIFKGTDGGLSGFKRKLGQSTIEYPPESIVYFWEPDADVELGPPLGSAADAALSAAGVLSSVDQFATNFMQRGAIKTTLLRLPADTREEERDRVNSWWRNLTAGIRKSSATVAVNADRLDPVVVGEGLEGLTDTNLTDEKRNDIATALGVPQSAVFANAANYATAQQDERNAYNDTIIPQAQLISEAFNDQLLHPRGFALQFQPWTMDIFQQDENQRAAAFSLYVNAGMRQQAAADMLGLELPDEGVVFDEPVMSTPALPAPPEPAKSTPPPIGDARTIELDKWKRRARKRVQEGKPGESLDRPFKSEILEPVMLAALAAALEGAMTPAEVDTIFADAFAGYP